ncbi:MAG: hypothetical protein E7534_05915 [Ruminococcaceae bacterium]|nr:hypothetical protein [Oscillospiraceae bacterium]
MPQTCSRRESCVMKRIVVLGLVMALFLSLFAGFSVSAASVTPLSVNFSSYTAGSALPSGYTVRQGSAKMGNGYMELAANTMLTLPSTYQAADFVWEIDFTIAFANEPTRWVSFMYRTQGTAIPTTYMQMCVRQGASASNGVETAYFNGSGWQYNSTASYSSSISASNKYTAKIETDGKYIIQSINGTQINVTDSALSTQSGGFGLQTNNSVMRVYAIRLSDKRDLNNALNGSKYIRATYEPTTKLVGAPTVIQTVDSTAKLNALKNSVKPQGAWLTVGTDSAHSVVLGNTTTTLKTALDACAGGVIPILEVSDMASAKYVAGVLKHTYYDVILASANTDVLSYFSSQYLRYTRRAYIAFETDMKKVAQTALSAGAMICVLQDPTRANVEYLQKRFLTVTTRRLDNSTDQNRVAAAVNCGANGVVVSDPAVAYNLYARVTTTTYVRRPFVIGHRGYPTVAPENTVEGMKAAFDAGADAVECDVWVTADNHVVINHNGNLGGYTTNASANQHIETLTRAQIKTYTLKAVGSYSNCKFAFLDEMFAVLKTYPDKVLVVEVKTTTASVVGLVRDLAKQYGVLDQIVFISFHSAQMERCRELCPEVGASSLGSGSFGTVAKGMESAYTTVQDLPSAFSPDYNITAALTYALQHRGISVNAWTINDTAMARTNAQKGVQFVTTDHSEFASQLKSEWTPKTAKQLWNITPAAATIFKPTAATGSTTKTTATAGNNPQGGNTTATVGNDPQGGTTAADNKPQGTTTAPVGGDTGDDGWNDDGLSDGGDDSGDDGRNDGDGGNATTTVPVGGGQKPSKGLHPLLWILIGCAVVVGFAVIMVNVKKTKKSK